MSTVISGVQARHWILPVQSGINLVVNKKIIGVFIVMDRIAFFLAIFFIISSPHSLASTLTLGQSIKVTRYVSFVVLQSDFNVLKNNEDFQAIYWDLIDKKSLDHESALLKAKEILADNLSGYVSKNRKIPDSFVSIKGGQSEGGIIESANRLDQVRKMALKQAEAAGRDEKIRKQGYDPKYRATNYPIGGSYCLYSDLKEGRCKKGSLLITGGLYVIKFCDLGEPVIKYDNNHVICEFSGHELLRKSSN